MLTMPPEEEASLDPSGQVFDLQEKIDDRFPRAVHGEGYIVEARDGDVLTQRELWELYQNTERLRQADAVGELAPSGLESQPYLYHYYSAGFERNIFGIYSLADAVHEVLTADFNTTLETASDDQVKVALYRVFSEPRGSEFVESLAVKATNERRRVLGHEIDYWSSPALFTSVVADNDKLGGGSVSIGASSDDTTKQKERFNRNVQRTLRGDQESYRLWGIAIDIGLEIENEAGLTGPFIAFTVIAVLVVVGLALRSYWAVAVTGAGMGILMIWLKGISNLIGLKSGLTIDLIVPIAMVSLGVDFAIHALRRYGEERDKGYSPRRAFTVGMAGVLGALALAFVTTGVAFLANVSSEIEAVIPLWHRGLHRRRGRVRCAGGGVPSGRDAHRWPDRGWRSKSRGRPWHSAAQARFSWPVERDWAGGQHNRNGCYLPRRPGDRPRGGRDLAGPGHRHGADLWVCGTGHPAPGGSHGAEQTTQPFHERSGASAGGRRVARCGKQNPPGLLWPGA